MQSLALTGNFRELTDDEMQEVNGGAKPIVILAGGAISGALIGAVSAARKGECWISGAGTGAVKGTLLATTKVMALGTQIFNAVEAGYWSIKAFKATDAAFGK